MKPLTAKQVECLRELAKDDYNPCSCPVFGSTTVRRLRSDGLITGVGYYAITDAGRVALAEAQS